MVHSMDFIPKIVLNLKKITIETIFNSACFFKMFSTMLTSKKVCYIFAHCFKYMFCCTNFFASISLLVLSFITVYPYVWYAWYDPYDITWTVSKCHSCQFEQGNPRYIGFEPAQAIYNSLFGNSDPTPASPRFRMF